MEKVEHLIEQFNDLPAQRKRALAGGALVVLIIFGIGLNTVFASVLGGHPVKKQAGKDGKGSVAQVGEGKTLGEGVSKIDDAKFDYLTPKTSSNWKIEKGSEGYVAEKQIAKYNLQSGGNTITVTQQMLPAALSPRESGAFSQFIVASKVSRSQDVGQGTLYFLPLLQNGVPAAGSDTIIYATDELLIFGRASAMMAFDKWVELFYAMK